VNLQRFRTTTSDAAGIEGQERKMSGGNSLKESRGSWESFVGLWERASLIRAFSWSHQTAGNKTLLAHFLVRLRRFFGVDFCFGALILNGDRSVEVGVPETALGRLPSNFSRRCLGLVANSRAPITWNELNGEFGFRSTVVAPLAPPVGRPFGFLLLGHSSRRTYSSAELFILQALAGDLSWAVRDLVSKQQHQKQLAGLSHDVKNALQVIIGNAALIRQKLNGIPANEHAKHIGNIEASVQEILERMNRLPAISVADDDESDTVDETVIDIAAAVGEAVDSCREAIRDRGVAFEITYAPQFPGDAMTDPTMFKRLLATIVGNAALSTRNETVQLAVQREAASLEFAVKGTATSKAAEKLKSLFESGTRFDGVREKSGEGVLQMKEYVENAGGDVYLRSRPGEVSEFVVCLPIDGKQSAVRSKLTN